MSLIEKKFKNLHLEETQLSLNLGETANTSHYNSSEDYSPVLRKSAAIKSSRESDNAQGEESEESMDLNKRMSAKKERRTEKKSSEGLKRLKLEMAEEAI